MLKNYVLVGIRSLRRAKGFSLINMIGLAIGLACFILILLFVRNEFSYDRFYAHADRIYRVVKRNPADVFLGSDRSAATPALLARSLAESFPEVAVATTIARPESALIGLNEQHYWENGLWADAHFFGVFTFPLLRGNPQTALSEPHSLVLTVSLARKLFGNENPVGRTVIYQNRTPYEVTGVMPDVPQTSHFAFDFVAAIQSNPRYAVSMAENMRNDNNVWFTYFTLAKGADAAQLREKMPGFVARHLYAGTGNVPEKERVQYDIQALTDIHLGPAYNYDIGTNGNITYVYLYVSIGLAILLLACINYTNLAIARSIKRAREVGMRQVVGALRRQIVGQFLGESVLMAFLAFGLALGLVDLLLPLFGRLMARSLQINDLHTWPILSGLIALVAFVGVLSGSYPAFFMASLRPIRALKGRGFDRTSRFLLQRALIVVQYAASIALIAGSLVIYEQLHYVRHKNLGYDRAHIVAIGVRDSSLSQNYATLRDRWLRDPHIASVTASMDLPTNILRTTTVHNWEGSSAFDHATFYWTGVNYDFLDTFSMKLVAGRPFSREMPGDASRACLINEKAARTLGWTPEEAVGKHLTYTGGETNGETTVIGVVQDFYMHSMHLPVNPLMIRLNTNTMAYISVKVRPEDLPKTIAFLGRTVKQITPYPFEYQFLDEIFDQLYREDLRLGQTFGFFTVLALLIASLGLFGLAAFAAEQRTREIGIRKVLGANVAGLVALLSKDFLKLVGIAFIAAVPPTYFAMRNWLENFAYRIEIGPGVFASAGAFAFAIALLAVSYQSIKAALSDPVKSLRNE